MNTEEFFIQCLKKQGVLQGVGDDGVIMTNTINPLESTYSTKSFRKMIVATDSFSEGTHFQRHWLSLEDLAKKAMLVNISDIFAMNASPKYATLNITLPRLLQSEISQIAKGLGDIAKQYNISFIGGDTISGQILSFHITLFGELKAKPLLRKGLQKGDMMFYTGEIGSSLYALRWLLKGWKISKSKRFKKFISPTLHPHFIHKLARFAHCGLDISDGIYTELNRLSHINHLGFKLIKKSRHFYSGEEYEVLFAISPKHTHRLKNLAKSMRIKLHYLGFARRKIKIFKEIQWH